LSGKTILVVDDELDCLQLTRLVLEMHGARVITATSVADAMEIFTLEQPDLVLTDVCMPDETGLTLVEKIRAHASGGRNTPTIAMSARTELHDRARVMSAGFDHFLPKPYLPEALVGLLHRALDS
jgi:two-component system OmpR family response regulator